MKIESVREKYDKFVYKAYKIEENEENIFLKYDFEIENLCSFQPMLVILKKKFPLQNLYADRVKNIAFHIGMVEAMSYWKACCSKYFCVECGALEEPQKKWFQKLFYLGLGEFRYQNKITIPQEEFVQFQTSGEHFSAQKSNRELRDYIIPIGGGKDSNVTLELLKDLPQKRYGFRINLEEVSHKCAEIAGLADEDMIEVRRKIDPALIRLNEAGFLNGHTPFSALVAFITYFAATVFEKKYIVLSNEDSANESNIAGENINHQYSKTLEFENDFRWYVKHYICEDGPAYFSFLRPLSELQIAKLFSELEAYHGVFKSCNVGSKSKPWKWCCHCPKCLFAYIILSPFLYKEKLVAIFGEDLFEKESLLQTFRELCGYAENKPFECVGTYREIRAAVSETIRKADGTLPFLLDYYQKHFEIVEEDLRKLYNKENNLPPEFERVLRGKIGC